MNPDDGLPLPEHDADRVRDAADRIVGGSELEDRRNLIQRLADWLVDFLGDLFGGFGGAGDGLGAVGTLIQLLLLALAVTVIGLAVRALLRAQRGRLGVEKSEMTVVLGVPGDPDELRRLSEGAESAGEWKAALLGRYRLIVATLVSDGVLADVPGRTTGEYRQEFAEVRPGQSSTFGAATRAFEAAYFGDVEVGPGDVEDMRTRASTLLVDRVVAGAGR